MKKQGSVTLALVVTTAAITSFLAPVPRPIESPMTSVPQATSGPAAGKVSFEIRQAPVPLLMKPRPPLEQPTFDADAVNPALVSELSPTAGDRVSLVANLKDVPGANVRLASGQPTAAGTRWAP